MPRRLLLLCCTLLIAASATTRGDGGMQPDILGALRAGEIKRGFDLASSAAAAGDSWAMDVVGALYLSGYAPAGRDYPAARRWLERAADAGNGDSMSRLGEIYFNGWGVPQDRAAAVSWYRRGVERGSTAALNNLAVCLLNGEGVEKDPRQGLELLKRAAVSDPAAQENLALIERSGSHGERNAAQALDLYRQSAEHGSSAAMLALAQMYFTAEGTPQDLHTSCRWAIIAYGKGSEEAGAHVAGVCKTRMSTAEFRTAVDEAKLWIDRHPEAFGPLARP